jgi:hypothetical protein
MVSRHRPVYFRPVYLHRPVIISSVTLHREYAGVPEDNSKALD